MPERFHLLRYREQDSVRGAAHRLPRPLVDVDLFLGGDEAAVTALVDTGSPRTVFPRGAAVKLGIHLPEPPYPPDLHLKTLKFLGHDWVAVSETVTLVLRPYDDIRWDAEVDFLLEEGPRFGLLGHEGFLDRWAVSFNAYHSYFVVEPVEELHQRVPIDVFEAWQKEYPDYN